MNLRRIRNLSILSLGRTGINIICLVAIVTGALLAGCRFDETVVYISPDGNGDGSRTSPCSLDYGREKLRTMRHGKKQDIVVFLHGGVYQLHCPIELNGEDSPEGSVILRACPGETPVISGGIGIANWSPIVGTKIWQAHCPANLKTRQLYVNGKRAVRATSHGGIPGTVQQTSTGYVTTDSSLSKWKHLTDLEFVYTGGRAGSTPWTERRCGVAAISSEATKTVITMKQPCYSNMLGLGKSGPLLPTAIENARELLDEPGEWYLDVSAATFYYLPRPNEDMKTAVVVAPVLQTLLQGKGTRNIQFQGITFSFATWLEPSGPNGFAELQANYVPGNKENPAGAMPANIYFQSAKNVCFERCIFAHLGAQGLAFDHGSQSNIVVGNIFTDISGSAIRIGDAKEPNAPRALQERGNRICNNYIHDVCAEFHGGVGILAGYVADTEISHNDISNLPYTGISVGWGWGAPSYMENNRINSNRVEKVMQLLQDGGAIYTLSAQSNSVLTGNYLLNCTGTGVIYHDEGSAYFRDRSNVVESTGQNWLSMWTASIHDNDIQTNWHNSAAIQNNGRNNVVANNVLVSNDAWPLEARTVTNNAGLEPDYGEIRH